MTAAAAAAAAAGGGGGGGGDGVSGDGEKHDPPCPAESTLFVRCSLHGQSD